uniref:Uncharacterized protein n=1 Tax=Anguilla anguilla TaxID=7936 RepID=A0A0E9WFE7_ANGAN
MVEKALPKCPLEWRKREGVPYWLPFTWEKIIECPFMQ